MPTNAQGKKLEDLSFLELEKKIDSLFKTNGNALPLVQFYIKNQKKRIIIKLYSMLTDMLVKQINIIYPLNMQTVQ